MKKNLLTFIIAFLLFGQSWGQTLNKIEGARLSDISQNGKWSYTVVAEGWDGTPGGIVIYDIVNDKLTYHEAEVGAAPYVDAASDNGYFAGSLGDMAAVMDENGNWRYLSYPADSDIYSSTARGISNDGSVICGLLDPGSRGARIPIVLESQGGGEYTYTILPAPEKDFSQLTPQAADALRVSADGTRVFGRFIDYSGMSGLILVWEKNTGNDWEYRLLGEDLIFNEGVELPFFDPDNYPTALDPMDYFTEADMVTYEAALLQYQEDIANDPDNAWMYENPQWNKDKYITDNRDQYDTDYAEFVRQAEEYNEAMFAYYDALDRYRTGYQIDVTFFTVSGNGNYLAVTTAYPDLDSGGWFPQVLYSPMYFNIETGEYKMFDFEKDAIIMGATDTGDIYYATPYRSYSRSSFVIPAGTEDSSIDMTEWVLTKSGGAIDLSEHFYYEWLEYDYVSGEDVLMKGVITGSVSPSVDGNVLISTFQAPDGSGYMSYTIDFGPNIGAGIKKDEMLSGIAVYPNPVEDWLTVTGEFTGLTLMNMNGAVMLKSKENNVNVSSLPTGVYLLKVDSADKSSVLKKVIKK